MHLANVHVCMHSGMPVSEHAKMWGQSASVSSVSRGRGGLL